MIKKVIFSFIQANLFLYEPVRGKGQLDLRVVSCSWPGDDSVTRFLVLGTMTLPAESIFTKVSGALYPLNSSPQREFFSKLEEGADMRDNLYYSVGRSLLNDQEFQVWLDRRSSLLWDFSPSDPEFLPVVVRRNSKQYVIEDGAHRLSLRSLRGFESHKVGIGIWHISVSRRGSSL